MLTYDVALHRYALAGFSAAQATTAREYLYGYVVQGAGQTAAAAHFYASLPESSQPQHNVLAAALRAAETVR
jgi:hypothetical protein